MKYILMMNTMKAGNGVPGWPKKDLQAHIAFMMGLNKELHERGELVSAEGLSARGTGSRPSWPEAAAGGLQSRITPRCCPRR